MRVYIAGKLDTKDCREQLEKINSFCESKGWSTYLPHRDAGLANGTNHFQIYQTDKEELLKADIVIANLKEIDEGTCWELGYANAHNIPIFALGKKRNIMLSFEIEYVKQLSEIQPKKRELITVEGLDGVGKSFHLQELGFDTDDTLSGFGLRLFRSLNTKDLFLREGYPLQEALTLLTIDSMLGKVCDRGLDSIALYYAIQQPDFKKAYLEIYALGKKLDRHPSKTILLTDEFECIMTRLETRDKKTLSQEELQFLKKVEQGYKKLLEMFPWRFHTIDLSKENSIEKMKLLIQR